MLWSAAVEVCNCANVSTLVTMLVDMFLSSRQLITQLVLGIRMAMRDCVVPAFVMRRVNIDSWVKMRIEIQCLQDA